MPKIDNIETTPNPNAVKFLLKEPVTNGTTRSFHSVEQAAGDALGRSLFEVGEVASVFYMDRMITIEKQEDADWDELLPRLAVPIRAAESANVAHIAGDTNGNGAQAIGGALGAVMSDDPRLMQINDILDEEIRPALAGDGGWLEVIGLKEDTLTIRYQGACGSCPSSLTGTLMAIEKMVQDKVDPNIEVVAV